MDNLPALLVLAFGIGVPMGVVLVAAFRYILKDTIHETLDERGVGRRLK